jgi:predicted CXXCH cytochrome family protein
MKARLTSWLIGFSSLWALAGLCAVIFFRPETRAAFIPGSTTHGHHQIENDCTVCHTPWMSVKSDACNQCHAEDLKKFRDTHPKSKFTDPRNADRLKNIAADECITCHREHRPAVTHAMGVTQPDDYCFHCHQDIAKDRPTHAGLAFSSCSTAGCHNYHDNTALYEDFIAKRIDEPALKKRPFVVVRETSPAPATPTAPGPFPAGTDASVLHDWQASAHARAGVDCAACHQLGDTSKPWIQKPSYDSCSRCHEPEVKGFQAGLHGMRIAAGLSPMTPAMAQLPMKPSAAHRELSCNSCHAPHAYDTRKAAAESCMQCHNDTHTQSYAASPHAKLWAAELAGTGKPGSGVSCATCHLARSSRFDENDNKVVSVEHNQNANLRPNEKMIRSVCLDCHGLPMVLDALADRALIDRNFDGPPSVHVESIDLILRRKAAKQKEKSNTH